MIPNLNMLDFKFQEMQDVLHFEDVVQMIISFILLHFLQCSFLRSQIPFFLSGERGQKRQN